MPATTEKKHPNVIAAVCSAAKEFLPIEKDQVNPHFKSKYSGLSSYIKATKDGLANNGLAIHHTMGPLQADGSASFISTLVHAGSDTSLTATVYMYFTATMQSEGSAQTYGMRQNLRNLLNIEAGDDDDGNAAAGMDTRRSSTPPPRAATPDRLAVGNSPPAPKAVEKPGAAWFKRIDLLDDSSETVEAINKACAHEPLTADSKMFETVWDYWANNIRAQKWGDEEKEHVSNVLMTKHVDVEMARQLAVEEQES